MKFYNICILSLVLILSCKDDDNQNGEGTSTPTQIEVNGLTYANSNQSFDATVTTLINALDAANPVTVVAQVDHTANALSIGETLNNTTVVLFGNPALGTPLMQNNQLAGLDLPQKYLIFEDDDNVTRVAFNDAEYLSQRHALQGEESLTSINGALRNFASMTSESDPIVNAININQGQGIVTKVSANNFDLTYSKLFTAIDENPNLSIIAEVDHQANAMSVNLELRPTRLIIFGNPNLGTPLMQSSQTTGIDLPQKMLVWQAEDGTTNVAFNDPTYLVTRHDLSDVDDQISAIATALDNLSNAAITE